MNTVCLCTQLADEKTTEEERDTVYDAADGTGKMLRTLLQISLIFFVAHTHTNRTESPIVKSIAVVESNDVPVVSTQCPEGECVGHATGGEL